MSDATFTGAIRTYGFDAVIAGIEAAPVGGWPESTVEDLVETYPELVTVSARDHVIDGPGGPVAARSYVDPGASLGAALVWVHGGAYLFGDLDMLEAQWVGLALAARGVAVLSVDYRKCLHGVHFPAPSDDVLAAWSWVAANSDVLGVAPEQIHLGGASAGANLAAGVAKRLRDAGRATPASLVLAYGGPHADPPPPTGELEALLDRNPPAERFDGEVGRAIRRHLVGPGGDLDDPYAFPASGDLRGLPPVLVLNAELDGLRASGELFGRELAAAGVEVAIEMEPGTEHGYLGHPDLPSAVGSIERIVEWILRHPIPSA